MATANCAESTAERGGGDDGTSLMPRRTSSAKSSEGTKEEHETAKMLSSSMGGSGSSGLFSPSKKKRGFLRVSSPAVNADGDKKENQQKIGGVEPVAAPSRRFVLPLFSNQLTTTKRDRRSSADAQLKERALKAFYVPKSRSSAETPTPTSEGMSLFQRLTQGRSGSTSMARTPTSPMKGSRHLSDASDLRPHSSSSIRDRDITGTTLQTVDEGDGSPFPGIDPSPSPNPRTASRMSSLAVDKADDRDLHSMERSLLSLLDEFRSGQLRALREDTMAQMREVRAKQEQLTKLHFELYTDQRRVDAMHQSKPLTEEERKRAREREDANYDRLTNALQDLQKSMNALCDSERPTSHATTPMLS